MLLTDRVRVELGTDQVEDVDIFADAAAGLFPDETRNSHGEMGATVVYASSKFGDVRLSLPDPNREEERRLFAHYLWNAGIYCAAQIEHGLWRVDQAVLELGAGLGLVGIISALSGAQEVVLSDYPAGDVLLNLSRNVKTNVPSSSSKISVHGHIWGNLQDDLSSAYRHHFEHVFAADCFWMPGEHRNLARSMLHFLSLRENARVYAVAGFHTGRAKLAPFFDVAQDEGLEIESVAEVDVAGVERSWLTERDGGKENVSERKRWLVVAVLKRPLAHHPAS